MLLDADADSLRDALASADSVYIQTNSRAIDEAAAVGLLRRLRLGLARRLLAGRAPLARLLGRWVAPPPPAGSGQTACGACQKAGCAPRPADHMRNTP